MPRLRFRKRLPNGKQANKVYDTDKSVLICQTPKGYLYKKKNYLEFYLYRPNGKTFDEKITRDLPWEEAGQLCHQFGTKQMYDALFTVRKKSTNSRTGPHRTIILDDRTRIMAMRQAYRLHMSLTEFVRFLIQKWDDYHWSTLFSYHFFFPWRSLNITEAFSFFLIFRVVRHHLAVARCPFSPNESGQARPRSAHFAQKTTRLWEFSQQVGRFILVIYSVLNRALASTVRHAPWGFFCPLGGNFPCDGISHVSMHCFCTVWGNILRVYYSITPIKITEQWEKNKRWFLRQRDEKNF